jgi:hypothetical protein
MTVYVLNKEGELVPKCWSVPAPGGFPSPRVSRFESFDSPITGSSISSWRQRDRDMDAVDAVDRRDIPQAAFEKRKRIVERNGRARKSGG